MNTTTPPKPRRMICSPMWGSAHGLKPITIDGWENIGFLNYGMGAEPVLRPGTLITPGCKQVDWEWILPKSKAARTFWVHLLRTTKPGDIAYGIDCGVNDARFDDLTQNIANTLRHAKVSMCYDLYIHPGELMVNWNMRVWYRLNRLRAIQNATGVDSVQEVCAIRQHLEVDNDDDYTGPVAWDKYEMEQQAACLADDMSILLFAPAATPEARAKVEEATRTLAGLVGGVTS